MKGYVQESLRMHQADKVEAILNQLYEEEGIKLLKDPDYWQAFDCCAADIDAPLSLAFIKNYKKNVQDRRKICHGSESTESLCQHRKGHIAE